jgi:hypothetical protein
MVSAYLETHTASIQCQVYAGVHLQVGSLAIGLLPKQWREASGLHLKLRLFIPQHGQHPEDRHQFSLRWYPVGGPKVWRQRREQRA